MNNDPSSIESSLKFAEGHCIAQGSKFTKKRKQVLNCLLESDKALSAYELADYCREKFITVTGYVSLSNSRFSGESGFGSSARVRSKICSLLAHR